MAAFPTSADAYKVECAPDRFETDCVIFRCAVVIEQPDTSDRSSRRELLPLEIPINLDDSDSFHQLRREALELYRNVLGHASKAASNSLRS